MSQNSRSPMPNCLSQHMSEKAGHREIKRHRFDSVTWREKERSLSSELYDMFPPLSSLKCSLFFFFFFSSCPTKLPFLTPLPFYQTPPSHYSILLLPATQPFPSFVALLPATIFFLLSAHSQKGLKVLAAYREQEKRIRDSECLAIHAERH